MIKTKYCPDTNIMSEILRKNEIVRKHMERALKNDNPVFICSIVYYEIIRGFKAAGSYRRSCFGKQLHACYGEHSTFRSD